MKTLQVESNKSLEYAFVFPTAEIFLNRATYQKPLVKTVYSCVKPPKRKLRFFCLFFFKGGEGGKGGERGERGGKGGKGGERGEGGEGRNHGV